MTEEEIEKNKIDFMKKCNICGLSNLTPDYIHKEFSKLGTIFKTMGKEVYHSNKFNNYVLVLYLSGAYYDDFKQHLINLAWKEIPRIAKCREYNFVKVMPNI